MSKSTPILEFPLGRAFVRVWTPDYMETGHPGGAVCPALFSYDDEAKANAQAWGYGPDEVWRMHLEHELTHTLLAQAQGQEWSPVLYHVAGGAYMDAPDRAREEGQVVAVQKVANQLRPLVDQYRKVTGRC
jgi:hypothetical protein